ncbi:hypothetical protein EKH55_4621 [Sinorhizobium alkalisoli]|nr:hypothetical protein EKH55_4621 [Sinorhizobium alkalisoli]
MAREETADLLRSSRRKFCKILFSAKKRARFHPACGWKAPGARMKNRNRILRNFRRDVPLQGLTAKAGGRLKGDIETGMVSCNRRRRQTIEATRSGTAGDCQHLPLRTHQPARCSLAPAKRSQQGVSTGRHISRAHVETTAVTISPAYGAATSRDAAPADIGQAVFNDPPAVRSGHDRGHLDKHPPTPIRRS